MAQEERIAYCPNCGAQVVYRLGRAECTRCNFIGDDAHAASAPQASRQGFQSYQPGGQQGGPQGSQPYSAPPPGVYGGQMYSPAGAASFDDPLRTEKWAFIGTNLLFLFVEIMVVFSSMGLGSMMFGAGIITFLVAGGVRFALMYFVMFGQEIWAKWTCLGCNSCSLLGLLPVLFMGPSLSNLSSGPAGSGGPPNSLQIYAEHPWLAVVELGVGGWLIYLLYRDIQNRQGYS